MNGWSPVTDTCTEELAPFPAQAMAALLNRPFDAGAPLPPLWHWLYALRRDRQDHLGHDGHLSLGRFLPPLPFPRRMWAGGALTFHAPLRVGDTVTRQSTVTALSEKTGNAGPIAFVTVAHNWADAQGAPRITERQDILFRPNDASAGHPRPAPESAPLTRQVTLDAVALFRYSALTYNGHRIHYDRDFCKAEGYDGLIVHGPLLATLLLDLLTHEGGATPKSFDYRATAPVTENTPFTLMGRVEGHTATLWVRRHDGALAMTGTARL